MVKSKNKCDGINRLSMFLLASSPILAYYNFTGSLSYYTITCVIIFFVSIFNHKFTYEMIPRTYIIYWIACAIQIYLFAGVHSWSDAIPGGMTLVFYSLGLFGFASTFNLDLLHKYMKWVFIFATIILFYQFFVYFQTHAKVCCFLPLADQLSYCDMTYSEIVRSHEAPAGGIIERFCSIFAEPSYYAEYSIYLLGIELFREENKHRLFTPFSVFVAFVIMLLQSGVGLLGLSAIAICKLVFILLVTRRKKYYFMVAVIVPIFLYAIRWYAGTTAGDAMLSRTNEFENENIAESSGYARVYYGWFLFGSLDSVEKLFGATVFIKDGFINGVTSLLCTKGLVCFVLLVWFYIKQCWKLPAIGTLMAILLLFISLIESLYPDANMLLVTTIVLGMFYQYRNTNNLKI